MVGLAGFTRVFHHFGGATFAKHFAEGFIPKAFQVVTFARLLAHDMDHNVDKIDQNPVALVFALAFVLLPEGRLWNVRFSP